MQQTGSFRYRYVEIKMEHICHSDTILVIMPFFQGGANVHVDTVLRTPQFWLLFTTSTLLATGTL
jgi:hypothetical protein